MMETNSAMVREIAVKFFEQYLSPATVKSIILDDRTWVVRVEAGLVNLRTFEMTVDSATGSILS